MTARTRPVDGIERWTRWARRLGIVAAIAGLVAAVVTSAGVAGIAVSAVPVLLLVGAEAITPRRSGADGLARRVGAQVGLDVAAVVVALVSTHPPYDHPLWWALTLPVLEGAVRFQTSGAILTWLGATVALALDLILRWTPGEGVAPLLDLGAHALMLLAAPLVVGAVSGRLVDELDAVEDEAAGSRRRARDLAVVAVAADRLAVVDGSEIAGVAVDAVVELGFSGAALVVVPSSGMTTGDGDAGARDAGDGDARVVASHGDPPTDLGWADLASAALGGSDVERPDGTPRRVGTQVAAAVAARGDRVMVLLADDGDDGADRHDDDPGDLRDEAFARLAGHVGVALRVHGREREAAAALRRARLSHHPVRPRTPGSTPAPGPATRLPAGRA